jgi:hypothetical protein
MYPQSNLEEEETKEEDCDDGNGITLIAVNPPLFREDQSGLETISGYSGNMTVDFSLDEFELQAESAAQAEDAEDEESIYGAVCFSWKRLKRKIRGKIFLFGVFVMILGICMIGFGIFLALAWGPYQSDEPWVDTCGIICRWGPSLITGAGCVIAMFGLRCISEADLEIDDMCKSRPLVIKLGFFCNTIVVSATSASFSNLFLIVHVVNIYFFLRCSHVIARDPGYARVTDLLRIGLCVGQFGMGAIFVSFAVSTSVPVDFYDCWCLLPYFQSIDIMDPFNENADLLATSPHILTACCYFLGSFLTYLLDQHAMSLKHSPTKRMFVAVYTTLFVFALSIFISFVAIQIIDLYSAPWASRFRMTYWFAVPLLAMYVFAGQARYLFRAGNIREFNAVAERKNWHEEHFPDDPPEAIIYWPAKREIHDHGYSSQSGLIAHGVYDMLTNDSIRRRNTVDDSSEEKEASAAQWCLCLVCSPLYFLLFDLLSVPYLLLSCCGCGTRRPGSKQRVNDDFLQNHPTMVDDSWASRHPEAVPSHWKAQKIWEKYSKKLPNKRYKLELFCLRRARLLQKLVRYTQLKNQKQDNKAAAYSSISKNIGTAKKIVVDGGKWIAKILREDDRTHSAGGAPVSEHLQRTVNPLNQKLLPADAMMQADQVSTTQSFLDAFTKKGDHFKQALDECIAAKYSGVFSPELLLALDTSLAASAAATREKEATVYCPACSKQIYPEDQFCSDCGTSLAGAAELHAAVQAVRGGMGGTDVEDSMTDTDGVQEFKTDNIEYYKVGQSCPSAEETGNTNYEVVEITPLRVGSLLKESSFVKLRRQVSGSSLHEEGTGPGVIKIAKRIVASSASIQTARKLFHEYDTDGSNGLDEDELYKVIAALRGGHANDFNVIEAEVQAMVADLGTCVGLGAGETVTRQTKSVEQYEVNRYYEKLQGMVVEIVPQQGMEGPGLLRIREGKVETRLSNNIRQYKVGEYYAKLQGTVLELTEVTIRERVYKARPSLYSPLQDGSTRGSVLILVNASVADRAATVDEEAFIRWWTSAGGGTNTLEVAPDHNDKFSVRPL